MTQLVELDGKTHASIRIAADSSVLFAADQHVLVLRASEIAHAVASFPVFAFKAPNTGSWALAAVTGLEAGRNLFVVDGEWTAAYTPLVMQTPPLYLMESDANQNQYCVGIDTGSAAISEQNGEALFTDDGKPSPYLGRLKSLLESTIELDGQTQVFLKRLDELSLFKSININVVFSDGNVQTITGLHTIDEDALKALSTDLLADLNERGYLLPAHAMLISMFQLNPMIRRHNRLAPDAPVSQIKLELARDSASAEFGS